MAKQKIGLMVYFPPDVLEEIDRITERGERSAWIVEACREKLEREHGKSQEMANPSPGDLGT